MTWRFGVLMLVLSTCVAAATVQTQVNCWSYIPPASPQFFVGYTGTYSANCQTQFFEPYPPKFPPNGAFVTETESAWINPGREVEASSFHDQYNGGFAAATFSAQYVFTLTGGNLVMVPAPSGGEALGAWVTPCLAADGYEHSYPYLYDTHAQASLMGVGASSPWSGVQWSVSLGHSTCPVGTVYPFLLNVPVTMQLTLDVAAGGTINADASAQFTGFQFFDGMSRDNPIDTTYTFTLNEQLVPEPGSLPIMAAATALWLIFRLRRGR